MAERGLVEQQAECRRKCDGMAERGLVEQQTECRRKCDGMAERGLVEQQTECRRMVTENCKIMLLAYVQLLWGVQISAEPRIQS
jgi:hypothetical protein